jgi:hypothetical protein
MPRNANVRKMIQTMTINPPKTADGDLVVASATFQVVADLGTPRRLERALADKMVRRVRLDNGKSGYVLTSKGYQHACRAIIESATRELRIAERRASRRSAPMAQPKGE